MKAKKKLYTIVFHKTLKYIILIGNYKHRYSIKKMSSFFRSKFVNKISCTFFVAVTIILNPFKN